ncbi:DoxX family protein [Streptomyces sp. JB150]|uniref:DoxX family protein n=1 Tax=Streptomyces sp. JB150 TaxID=2714844 RepID=UPI0014072495|nr:DoxX family protein [Streptomyces sp. JB150]QIJ62091.1 DoxX family protein [Streptomyces sp. JB150]
MSKTTASHPATATGTPAGAATATGTAPASRGGRAARIALRAVQVLLALFFAVASALPKLVAHSSAVEPFERMGWGDVGMYGIGALELAGAVALLIPVLQSVAALALSGLMVGAFVVQLTVFDGEHAATPLILLVPLTLVAWARRGHTAELLRMLRPARHTG